jgi:hypothetical protein
MNTLPQGYEWASGSIQASDEYWDYYSHAWVRADDKNGWGRRLPIATYRRKINDPMSTFSDEIHEELTRCMKPRARAIGAMKYIIPPLVVFVVMFALLCEAVIASYDDGIREGKRQAKMQASP